MADSGTQFDVIVVGAGVMGSSTGYHLAKTGNRVLILEQFDFLHHRGSSHGESRTIRATYPEDYYHGLVMESYELWRMAEAEIGYRVYFPAEQLDIGPSDDKSLAAVVDTCRKHSIPHMVLDRGQLAEKYSGRVEIPSDWVAVWSKYGGVIKPTKAVSMFQCLAYKNGAVLKDNAEVVEIKRDESNGRIVVSIANGESFSGKKCVVTVGAWARKLVKSVSRIELPIQPLEATVSYWRIKEGAEAEYAIGGDFPTFASYGNPYVYGTPSLEFPGLIKVAMHGGHQCNPDKRSWGSGGRLPISALKEWIEERFGGRVDSSDPIATQLCMYSMTPDEDFVIDFLGGEFEKDVVIGGGFSGHGFKMSPAIGRILAELALKGEAEGVELKYFKIARFEENPKGNIKSFADQVKLL
ncbi:probable sarcosine oxidase [Benincasa hispida]|uniref:probable sarcosine oxidase n=1 Tax=Benincasa hispida TaxID=102211 RepID=UPI001900B029|nr:probable sarcosine oxidase [Benincasa hispida]